MRRLVIIVEGDTEKEFVDQTLSPYLYNKGVHSISCYKIKKTNGGLNNYSNLRTDIVSAIYEENVLVTTLIDFYALPQSFPKYEESKKILNKEQRVTFLEKAIVYDLNADGHLPQLHPYIQLHEFEAFLFSNIEGFALNFTDEEANLQEIKNIIEQFPNPEEINDGATTSPSKRLQNLIPGYRKIVFGNTVIESNGIDQILQCCPRFKSWVEELVRKISL